MNKTKFLQTNCTENAAKIKIGDKPVEEVKEFIAARDGSFTTEINQRLLKASTAMFKLKERVFDDGDLRIGAKLAVYLTMIITTFSMAPKR